MSRLLFISIFLTLLVYPFSFTNSSINPSLYITCFTPPEHCGDLIVSEINKAKSTIYVQAYGFTHTQIISALIEAKKRGVDVQIILDRSNFTARYKSNLNQLSNIGIRIFKDKISGIAHNKVMVIDSYKVITGSFNFTGNADKRNAENVLIILDNRISETYYNNWLLRKGTSP